MNLAEVSYSGDPIGLLVFVVVLLLVVLILLKILDRI